MSDSEDAAPRVAIGITFGNSYSSISHTTVEGRAEVIANEEGDRQIPSILSYIDGEEFQGTQAKAQLVRNAKNTVAYWRDFLGKSFESVDPTPCHQSAHPIAHDKTVAFSIHDSESEEPNNVTVSEITTRHLRRLKDSASDFLGKQVTAAVMTVPTNFAEVQKDALREAAQNAGIEVLQFINEPVAALLAYDARPEAKLADKIVVVADLGGTRSDVAVIASRGGVYTLLATSHDWEVSGSKLDEALMDHFAKEFRKKYNTAGDPRKDERSLAKLRLESEAVKKALSLGSTASFSVESLSAGIDFTATITRTRFELLARAHFAAITRLIQSTVEKAGLDPLDVSEIVLCGGTSHVPRVATSLQSAFPEKTVVWAPATRTDAINPSELVARGAAIQASLVADFDQEDIRESCHPVVTVTPHLKDAIGVLAVSGDERGHGKFVPIVLASTSVPVRRTAIINGPPAGGDVLIKICEGSKRIHVEHKEKKEREPVEADSDDSDAELSEDEEPIKSEVWHTERVIAEAALRGVAKGAKIEVQINVGPDTGLTIVAREVGGKASVRGSVPAYEES
ncbi:heat shock protein-like protein 70 [Trichodelitschia bisporula]|uniref:Heat shock protein-like protein 70 n=1 Tax=Trichodelitschia bisporula TaxID=703511 RepID=A0A6G1HMT7_9PEZI|nr:heat shock protein-like protein 70 [Trichodelitschia bisporula]